VKISLYCYHIIPHTYFSVLLYSYNILSDNSRNS